MRSGALLLLSIGLTSGCGSGVGVLDGIDFEPNDAIYTKDRALGTTIVLVSDVEGLCSFVQSDRSMAGYSELAIRSWSTGSARVDYRSYDGGCSVTDRSSSNQGWVAMHADGDSQLSVDFAFRAADRNLSGQIQAEHCRAPTERDAASCPE